MNYYPHVKKAIGGSEKIFEYVDRSPEIPSDGTLAPQKLNGNVEFQNVTFSYPKRPDTAILKVSVLCFPHVCVCVCVCVCVYVCVCLVRWREREGESE